MRVPLLIAAIVLAVWLLLRSRSRAAGAARLKAIQDGYDASNPSVKLPGLETSADVADTVAANVPFTEQPIDGGGLDPSSFILANPAAPVSSAGLGYQDTLDSIAQAWSQFEGSDPDNRNWRNKNPVNLKWANQPGWTGTDEGGFTVFGDVGDGWDAANRYIDYHAKEHPDWDLYDFFDWAQRGSTTAPTEDDQGNSDTEAEFVANQLGVPPTTTLSSLLGYTS